MIVAPTSGKGVRRILDYARLYRCFIKDFSKIAKLLTQFLAKDTLFVFTNKCPKTFGKIKEVLKWTPHHPTTKMDATI